MNLLKTSFNASTAQAAEVGGVIQKMGGSISGR
jgi:hypothetical protein